MEIRPNAAPVANGADRKEWTVLLYMNGNNNIEGDVLTGFLTAEEVSEHSKMNVLAELGRAPQSIAHASYKDEVDGDWDGVRRYVMKKGPPATGWHGGKTVYTSMGQHDGKIDSELVADLGKADMSSRETLTDFLKWGMKSYPAKHYLVVLAGHGGGFLGSLPDYKSDRNMSLSDTAQAFKDAEKETGIKPDVLAMDACLMSQAEAVGQLHDAAKYYVASEDVNFSCLPFQAILKTAREKWDKGGEVSPGEMAAYIVDGSNQNHNIPTISALKTDEMQGFTQAAAGLANSLLATDTDPAVIRNVIRKTRNFAIGEGNLKPFNDFKDLKDFSMRLTSEKRISDTEVKKAAQSLIDKCDSMVINEGHKNSHKDGIFGISVYLPVTGFNYDDWGFTFPYHVKKSEFEPIYRSLEFTKETGWDKVIDKFADAKKNDAFKGESVVDGLIRSS